jgi:hypothetical protein
MEDGVMQIEQEQTEETEALKSEPFVPSVSSCSKWPFISGIGVRGF